MTKSYHLTEKIWLYPGKAAWCFVTVPSDVTENINFFFGHVKRGWGSLPVMVKSGDVSWSTSIFPDKKTKSYLLPIKAEVRKKLEKDAGDELDLEIELHD